MDAFRDALPRNPVCDQFLVVARVFVYNPNDIVMFVGVSTDFGIIKLDYYTLSRGEGEGGLDEHDATIRLAVYVRTVYLFDYDNIIILMDYYLQCYLMTKRRRSRRIFTIFRSENTCFQLAIDRNKEHPCI